MCFCFSCLLIPRMEFVGHVITLCITFWKATRLICQVAVPIFDFYHQHKRIPVSPFPHQHLLLSSFIFFPSHSSAWESILWCLHCASPWAVRVWLLSWWAPKLTLTHADWWWQFLLSGPSLQESRFTFFLGAGNEMENSQLLLPAPSQATPERLFRTRRPYLLQLMEPLSKITFTCWWISKIPDLYF